MSEKKQGIKEEKEEKEGTMICATVSLYYEIPYYESNVEGVIKEWFGPDFSLIGHAYRDGSLIHGAEKIDSIKKLTYSEFHESMKKHGAKRNQASLKKEVDKLFRATCCMISTEAWGEGVVQMKDNVFHLNKRILTKDKFKDIIFEKIVDTWNIHVENSHIKHKYQVELLGTLFTKFFEWSLEEAKKNAEELITTCAVEK